MKNREKQVDELIDSMLERRKTAQVIVEVPVRKTILEKIGYVNNKSFWVGIWLGIFLGMFVNLLIMFFLFK